MAQSDDPIQSFFARLSERYGTPEPPPLDADDPQGDPLVGRLVRSLMLWEASMDEAEQAVGRLASAFIDYNELRVALPAEMLDTVGRDYPAAEERCLRLRLALNDVFNREHALTIEPLRELTKREARAYLDSIEGLPPFVASRLTLLDLGGHAFPLDVRLLTLLERGDAIEPDLDLPTATTRVERSLRAGESLNAYLLLETWAADGAPGAKPKSDKPRASGSGRASATKTSKRSPRKAAGKPRSGRTP